MCVWGGGVIFCIQLCCYFMPVVWCLEVLTTSVHICILVYVVSFSTCALNVHVVVLY